MARHIWTGPDERGRLAKSLIALYDQIDSLSPSRDHDYDGSIGDAAHQARTSDHNPLNGVVHALDITDDPEHGVAAQEIADQIIASRDPRVDYLIHNGRISNPKIQNWKWRDRNQGPGDHTEHLHVSVVDDNAVADSTTPWAIKLTSRTSSGQQRFPLLKQGANGARVRELQALLGIPIDGTFGTTETLPAVKAFQTAANIVVDGDVGGTTWARLLEAKTPKRLNENIKATVFNDTTLAYGPVPIDTIGFSLPAPVPPNTLIWARNRENGWAAVGPVIDKGPWYDGTPEKPADEYWKDGKRPRAEGDAHTNGAGIDLYPAAADALGISYTERGGQIIAGGGQIDWGFLEPGAPIPVPTPAPEPEPGEPRAPQPVPTDLAAAIAEIHAATIALADITRRLEQLAGRPTLPVPQQPPIIDLPDDRVGLDPAGLAVVASIIEAVIDATPVGTGIKGVKAAAAVLRALGELAKRRQP